MLIGWVLKSPTLLSTLGSGDDLLEPSGVKVKGAAIKACVQFVIETYGRKRLAEVFAVCSAETREDFEAQVLVSAWYPVEHFEDFVVAADRLLGKGDLQLAAEMGRFSASYGVNVVYKLVMRIGTPEFAMRKGSAFWGRYYNSGRMEMVSLGKGHGAYRLYDFGYMSDVFCIRISGWMERFTELTGVDSVRVEHTLCTRRGDPYCEWQGHWK